MKKLRFIRGGWVLLLAALVLGTSFLTPALASTHTARNSNARAAAGTSVNATVYLTLSTLQPMFQSNLARQVPVDMNNAIASIVAKLPAQDQGWTREMATTLIQPSATLQNLVTQQNGMAMYIRIALYPGDPKPINAGLLISFSVLDSSTIQASASPLNNGPDLASGPQNTFQIPIGVLNGVNTTPSCGASALSLHLQIPVSLGSTASTSTQTQSGLANVSAHGNPMAVIQNSKQQDSGVNTFIEIPAASLAALSGSIGSMPVSSSFTAQNIRIMVEGSDIHLLADVYWSGLNVGTADTTIAPGASGGNLTMHVTNTNFSLFGLFNLPMNSYNQQIEQTLNSKLGTAFAGKFNVTNAAIGGSSQLPCAKSDSLVLTGTSSIG
ncbi:MAG TPA: hypothetical protein VJO32_06600 [Ktedonobacteraceae bacterium]|nr:hypothetical protein [Ktedonobacteraceae bacterium]